MSGGHLEDLIARCALGDRQAFTALYDRVSAKLYGITLRILRERSAAEDALQDAHVKIWRNADRYRVTGPSPMTRLITIARNTAIDRARAPRAPSDIDADADTLMRTAAGEAARRAACMGELDKAKRDAVRAAYFNGPTYAEIAKRHVVPLNTNRTWLRRGPPQRSECLADERLARH